ALRVGVDRDDLVAFDAAALVDHVDGVLVAEVARLRAGACERPGEAVADADLDLLVLGAGAAGQRHAGRRDGRSDEAGVLAGAAQDAGDAIANGHVSSPPSFELVVFGRLPSVVRSARPRVTDAFPACHAIRMTQCRERLGG